MPRYDNPPGYEDDPDEDGQFEDEVDGDDLPTHDPQPEFKASQGNYAGPPFKPTPDRRDMDDPPICGPLWSPQPRD